MVLSVFLIALIFIILLVALPFIFKLIFKTKKFLGYGMGVCCSIITIVAIIMIIIVGIFFFLVLFNRHYNTKDYEIVVLIYIFFFLFLIYMIIFLIIFYYTKEISNKNQPNNSVFMFIAGYLLPQFLLIYLYFIIVSLNVEEGTINITQFEFNGPGIIILNVFLLLLLYMIQIAGTIILSMLHHRKVNKYIFYILLTCYFLPFLFFLIGYIAQNRYILNISSIVLNIATLVFGVFYYCKYAKGTPSSELLEEINSI
jgi:hypothetical protein